jgi:hypothetical protein
MSFQNHDLEGHKLVSKKVSNQPALLTTNERTTVKNQHGGARPGHDYNKDLNKHHNDPTQVNVTAESIVTVFQGLV